MRIAIISDIHDNLPNLEKFLNWAKDNGIQKIIACGDLTTLTTIKNLACFPGDIFVIRGNADIYEADDLSKFQQINYGGQTNVITIDKLLIGLCHEPEKIALLIKKEKRPLDYIFYGHTHRPWLENKENSIVANPGNLAGTWYQATFAVLDTGSRELNLKILATL